MALGFVTEQQQQQQLLARVPIAALPKPGVGDAASAALNAAALQTLSMKQAEQQYRLYRGQIMYGRAGILLDGVHSHDVSYIADAPSQAAGGGNRSRVSDPRAGTERFFCANIKAIMKIQVIWKYRLKKMRGNKPTGICLSALGFW